MDSATNFSRNEGHVVIMGVAGCGKSSLGRRMATQLGWRLIEGDDYHGPESVRKMREGIALTDADRVNWLHCLGQLLVQERSGVVLTCSALRATYRQRLREAVPTLRFVFLAIDPEAAHARVAARADHIFPPSLVVSQFQTLEDPSHEDGVLRVDAQQPLDGLTAQVCQWLLGPREKA